MAQTGVNMTISAQDRFSSVLTRLEKRVNAAQAPVRKWQSVIKRADSSLGLARARQGFLGVTKTAWGMAKSLSSIVPPLGIITGAASIAGIYRLASGWARLGQRIGISARSIGMSPKKMQQMQSAAELAGGSAEGMTGALSGLANTTWNASHGFDPEAVANFKALGVSMKELETLSPDKLFERVADRLRKIKDPVAQMIAAQKVFGAGASGVLPILQQTRKAYEDNVRAAEHYGVLNKKGVDAAGRLAKAQTELDLAAKGFGNSLAETVEPVLTPIIHSMAEWIAANRQWIATDITGYVSKLVGWLKDGGWNQIVSNVKAFGVTIDHVAHLLGGWKTVAIGAAGAIALLFAAPTMIGLLGLAAVLLKIYGAFKKIKSVDGKLPSIPEAPKFSRAGHGSSITAQERQPHVGKRTTGLGLKAGAVEALPIIGQFMAGVDEAMQSQVGQAAQDANIARLQKLQAAPENQSADKQENLKKLLEKRQTEKDGGLFSVFGNIGSDILAGPGKDDPKFMRQIWSWVTGKKDESQPAASKLPEPAARVSPPIALPTGDAKQPALAKQIDSLRFPTPVVNLPSMPKAAPVTVKTLPVPSAFQPTEPLKAGPEAPPTSDGRQLALAKQIDSLRLPAPVVNLPPASPTSKLPSIGAPLSLAESMTQLKQPAPRRSSAEIMLTRVVALPAAISALLERLAAQHEARSDSVPSSLSVGGDVYITAAGQVSLPPNAGTAQPESAFSGSAADPRLQPASFEQAGNGKMGLSDGVARTFARMTPAPSALRSVGFDQKTDQEGKASAAYDYFSKQGWKPHQIAGILGGVLSSESAFNEHAVGDHGHALGLAQWHEDRLKNFKSATGKDFGASSYMDQLKFIQWELTHSEKKAGQQLAMAENPSQAAAAMVKYERPADAEGQTRKRAGLAEAWAAKERDAAQDRMQLDVRVSHKNAPPGSSVAVTSPQKSQLRIAGVRQQNAMSPQNALIGI